MITVKIFKHENHYRGISFDGHAGFAESGKDIVCSAVSILVINTINSIEKFTDDQFSCDIDEDDGHIQVSFDLENSSELILLMDSMILGLKQVEKNYGSRYISLQFEEV